MVPSAGWTQCISGNCTNGFGTLVWPSGARYDGDFKNGIRHGSGRYLFADGSLYVGEYLNGLRHGKGSFSWISGKKYVGEWVNGHQDGYGIKTWPDGRRQSGLFRDDTLVVDQGTPQDPPQVETSPASGWDLPPPPAGIPVKPPPVVSWPSVVHPAEDDDFEPADDPPSIVPLEGAKREPSDKEVVSSSPSFSQVRAMTSLSAAETGKATAVSSAPSSGDPTAVVRKFYGSEPSPEVLKAAAAIRKSVPSDPKGESPTAAATLKKPLSEPKGESPTAAATLKKPVSDPKGESPTAAATLKKPVAPVAAPRAREGRNPRTTQVAPRKKAENVVGARFLSRFRRGFSTVLTVGRDLDKEKRLSLVFFPRETPMTPLALSRRFSLTSHPMGSVAGEAWQVPPPRQKIQPMPPSVVAKGGSAPPPETAKKNQPVPQTAVVPRIKFGRSSWPATPAEGNILMVSPSPLKTNKKQNPTGEKERPAAGKRVDIPFRQKPTGRLPTLAPRHREIRPPDVVPQRSRPVGENLPSVSPDASSQVKVKILLPKVTPFKRPDVKEADLRRTTPSPKVAPALPVPRKRESSETSDTRPPSARPLSVAGKGYYDQGMAHLEQGNYRQAILAFSEALIEENLSAEARLARAVAYMKMENYPRAIQDFNVLLSLEPKSVAGLIFRGMTRRQMRENIDASRDLSLAISEDPDLSLAYFERGLVLSNMGRPKEAERDFDRVVAWVLSKEAGIRLEQGRIKTSVGRYVETMDVFYERGRVKARLGRNAEAIEDFSWAIKRNEQRADCYFERANAYVASRQAERALEDYSRAITLTGDEPDYYFARSFVYGDLKQREPMCRDLNSACNLGDQQGCEQFKKECP